MRRALGGMAGLGARRGKLRWSIVLCAFVISAVSYLDRNNLSIAGGSIREAFALTDTELGFVFSAFALGYALCQPFAGRIADRFGAYRCVAVAILWWSVFTALVAHVPTGFSFSLALLILIRLLLGVGESVIFPAGNRLIASWIPRSERGLANGLIFAGVGVGGGIAPPLITTIIVLWGWHWAFHISAALGIVVGLFWLVLVRDEPAEHPAITAEELAYIEAGVRGEREAREQAANGAADGAAPMIHWRKVLADRQVLLLTASYFCYGYVAYIFFSWFFLYLSEVRGLDLRASAILAMLPFIAMTVFSTLGGLLSDRIAASHGERTGRCMIAAAAMVLASLFVAIATAVESAHIASLVLAGGAGALYVAQSAYWTLSANVGGASSGVVSGIMNMGAQIGGVVTASTMPIVAGAFGWTASFLVAAVVALIGGLLWLVVDPHHSLAAS